MSSLFKNNFYAFIYIYNFLYLHKNGELMPSSYFTQKWKKWQQKSGLTVTAHQMRHTYNTMLFEADIDVKDALVIMGHADISTTRNVYTYVREKRLKATFEKMNNYINSNVH